VSLRRIVFKILFNYIPNLAQLYVLRNALTGDFTAINYAGNITEAIGVFGTATLSGASVVEIVAIDVTGMCNSGEGQRGG